MKKIQKYNPNEIIKKTRKFYKPHTLKVKKRNIVYKETDCTGKEY